MLTKQQTTRIRRIAFGMLLGFALSANAISTVPLSVIPAVEQAFSGNVSGLASQASLLTHYDALDRPVACTSGMVENVVNTPEAVVSTVLHYNTPAMLYKAYENWDTPLNLTPDLSGLKAAWDQFACPDPYVSSRAVGNLTSAVMMTIALGEMSKGSVEITPKTVPAVKLPGPTIDPVTGNPVGRFIGRESGPPMIEPVGGNTAPAGRGGVDTHTTYPNGSNYQRLNPQGHQGNPTPHAHGHAEGSGPGIRGQGDSLDVNGNIVPRNSPEAHWPFL